MSELLKNKREEIYKIASKHGVTSIRVFGSVAQGNVRPESDIDFLVEVGPNHSFFFPGGFVAELEALLGKHVDVVTPKGLHWLIRDQVLKEAVSL